MTRTSLVTMLAVLVALAQPAWAQGNGHGPGDGKGPGGDGPGHADNDGKGPGDNNDKGPGGNNGKGPGDNNGAGPGNGGGPGPGGNPGPNAGNGPGPGKGQGSAAPGNSGTAGNQPASNAPQELSESDALAAVAAGRAVELSAILPDLRARTGGEVINAQLQQVGSFLLYAVTVLTPSGEVITEHYYARTGAHVGR